MNQNRRLEILICLSMYVCMYVCTYVVHTWEEEHHRCVLLERALLRKKARIIARSCSSSSSMPLNTTRRRQRWWWWWWKHMRLQYYRSYEGEYKSIFVWLQTSSIVSTHVQLSDHAFFSCCSSLPSCMFRLLFNQSDILQLESISSSRVDYHLDKSTD